MESKKKDASGKVIEYIKEKKIYKKWWFWLISILIIGFVINVFKTSYDDYYSKPIKQVSAIQKSSPKKKSINDQIKSSADPRFGKVTKIEINDDLGKNDGGKIVLVYVKQDGLTKRTVDYNTSLAFAKVFKFEKVNEITYLWQATLVDVKGNESVETVGKIQMTKKTAKTINWKNFIYTNLDKVADQYNTSLK